MVTLTDRQKILFLALHIYGINIAALLKEIQKSRLREIMGWLRYRDARAGDIYSMLRFTGYELQPDEQLAERQAAFKEAQYEIGY